MTDITSNTRQRCDFNNAGGAAGFAQGKKYQTPLQFEKLKFQPVKKGSPEKKSPSASSGPESSLKSKSPTPLYKMEKSYEQNLTDSSMEDQTPLPSFKKKVQSFCVCPPQQDQTKNENSKPENNSGRQHAQQVSSLKKNFSSVVVERQSIKDLSRTESGSNSTSSSLSKDQDSNSIHPPEIENFDLEQDGESEDAEIQLFSSSESEGVGSLTMSLDSEWDRAKGSYKTEFLEQESAHKIDWDDELEDF